MLKQNNVKTEEKKVNNGLTVPIWVRVLSTILGLAVAVLVMVFIAAPRIMNSNLFSVVDGSSMEPTLMHNQTVFGTDGEISRGDIVSVHNPYEDDPKEKTVIKRVIGLPGETVSITKSGVFIDGKKLDEPYLNEDGVKGTFVDSWKYNEIVLSNDEIYIMGDNRAHSGDSRYYGAAKLDRVVCKQTEKITFYSVKEFLVILVYIIVCVALYLIVEYVVVNSILFIPMRKAKRLAQMAEVEDMKNDFFKQKNIVQKEGEVDETENKSV